MYGSDYILYGSKECPNCHQRHIAPQVIQEGPKSRFRLMQFAAEMTAYETKDQTRKAVADEFLKARMGSDLSKLNKNLQETRRAIENPNKVESIDRNKEKLASIQTQYSELDKKLTSGLRDIRRPFLARFPKANKDYSLTSQALRQSADMKFMLGILLIDKYVLISASGSGTEHESFKAAAALKGYQICGPVDLDDKHFSIVSRFISAQEYRGTQRGLGYQPGVCAAPRLLAKAFTISEIMSNLTKQESPFNLKNWQMSEIFYFPNSRARSAYEAESDKARLKHVEEKHKDTKGDPTCLECKQFDANPVGSLYWVPGLSAHSCETCEQLVPLLMCPKEPGITI